MKFEEIFKHTFKALLKETEWERYTLWYRCLSCQSQFCQAVVSCGYLTFDQMINAVCRYRLGASKKGGVIFWQIDKDERIHDGKVVYYGPDCHRSKEKWLHPTWVSTFMRKRYPIPNARHETSHCLFGLHLLHPHCSGAPLRSGAPRCSGEFAIRQQTVAVVEAEKTAVIMSEIFPNYIWMATGGLGQLQPEILRPLRGQKVILFPDTDPTLTAYQRWYAIARETERQFWWEDCPPINVSPLLERHATPEQKQRKIDIVDYLYESNKQTKTGR